MQSSALGLSGVSETLAELPMTVEEPGLAMKFKAEFVWS